MGCAPRSRRRGGRARAYWESSLFRRPVHHRAHQNHHTVRGGHFGGPVPVHKWRGRGAALGLLIVALVAVGCSSSKKNASSPTTAASSGGSSTTAAAAVKQGGDITLGAEQEPDTMDWISSDAGAAWGVYTVETNTMPRAYDYTD